MRCFCCNVQLPADTPLDKPTGRFYCHPCFEFTNDVILAMEDKKITFFDGKDKYKFSLEGLVDTIGVEVSEEVLEVLYEDDPYENEDSD